MNAVQYFFLLLFGMIIISCSDSSEDSTSENLNEEITSEWTIPLDEITGSDSPFPFAENPTLKPVSEIEGLQGTDQIVLVSFNKTIKAYPLRFIAPFEVINDQLDGISYAVSFCPVTESVICTENKQGTSNLSLVASGYRQNLNLIVKDINSNSFWTQMLITYVKGPFAQQKPKTLPMIETSWAVVKSHFPEAQVFASNSIVSKESTNAKTSDFGTDERVYGILNESNVDETSVSIVGFANFNETIKSYNQIIGAKQVHVFGSTTYNFITAFETSISTTLTAVQNEFPIIMKNAAGEKYNVFGVPVSNDSQGSRLDAPRSYLASWWAWQDFYASFQDL